MRGQFNRDPRALREEMQPCGSGGGLRQQAEARGLLWAAQRVFVGTHQNENSEAGYTGESPEASSVFLCIAVWLIRAQGHFRRCHCQECSRGLSLLGEYYCAWCKDRLCIIQTEISVPGRVECRPDFGTVIHMAISYSVSTTSLTF